MARFRRRKTETASSPDSGGKARRRVHPVRFLRAHKDVVGRVLLLLLVLAACVIPVLFVNDAISYIPLVSVVLIVVISYVYLRLLMNSLEYSEESLLDSCERGSEIEFVVNFVNKSPLVFVRIEPYFYISDLFGEIDTSIPASMPLMPHETRDFRFEASFDHIGTYSAGVSKIVISDLLGLFRHTIVNPNRHEVHVLPHIFDISRVDFSNVSLQESRKAFQPIVTDDMDYAGVREYVPGDPLKTIHWKLSSRNLAGEYYTRLFETFGNPGVDIIIDHSSPRYDHESLMGVFDSVVESALSVNEYARDKGIDSTIAYIDRYDEVRKLRIVRLEESDKLIDDIPRIDVGDGRSARELLRRLGNSIHSQGNIAYCTPHVDEETITSLIEIKRHKRNPLLFVAIPRALEGEERRAFLAPLRRLDEAQIAYYVVTDAADLDREVTAR